MNSYFKRGFMLATVCTAFTLGGCANGYYYGGGATYSTYPYTRPYVYPSSNIYLRYSYPRYYRYNYRGYRPYYYPRHYYHRPYAAPRYRGHVHPRIHSGPRYQHRASPRHRSMRQHPGFRRQGGHPGSRSPRRSR